MFYRSASFCYNAEQPGGMRSFRWVCDKFEERDGTEMDDDKDITW